VRSSPAQVMQVVMCIDVEKDKLNVDKTIVFIQQLAIIINKKRRKS